MYQTHKSIKVRAKKRKMRNYQTILNNGETLPIMGMGTYSGENDRETTETAIRTAIKVSVQIELSQYEIVNEISLIVRFICVCIYRWGTDILIPQKYTVLRWLWEMH